MAHKSTSQGATDNILLVGTFFEDPLENGYGGFKPEIYIDFAAKTVGSMSRYISALDIDGDRQKWVRVIEVISPVNTPINGIAGFRGNDLLTAAKAAVSSFKVL